MKPTKHFIVIFIAILAMGCDSEKESLGQITHSQDYETYLKTDHNEAVATALNDYKFWEEKLQNNPTQFPYLVKAAAAQSVLFNQTGKISHLIKAEELLVMANEATHYNNAGYLRALARNCISQHKFKQALMLLEKAENNRERLKSSQKMLFDVHLELGNTQEAKMYLDKIENYNDFDFLIRLSKWNDHEGNLENAIFYLEKAKAMVELRKDKGLMLWTYTNLADYYGHAGKIQDAYAHYLKALALNPNDAYAKKGIAWIVYSHEKNANEALRLLNTITKTYHAPDYYLLKAEIAEFKGDASLMATHMAAYNKAVANELYGDMYNTYNILLYSEDKTQTAKALKLAHKEIENRPTPQSYDLLAWTYYKHGDPKNALYIAEKHVAGETYEPETLFRLAEIYKANGKAEDAANLKDELLASTFELGPLAAKKIKNI